MTVKECEERITQLEGSLGELHGEVTAIKVGCAEMSLSHKETLTRLGLMEKQMTGITDALSRLEALAFSSQDRGKGTTSSSFGSPKVSFPLLDHGTSSLDSRGITSSVANRDTMLKKIDMPVFDGRLPYCWISRVERFFRLGQYAEEEKLGLVSLCLDGAVLNWFNGEIVSAPFHDWAQFKKRLLERFTPAVEDEPGKRILCLQQTGDIADYVNEFEALASQVTGVDEATLTNAFYNGLTREMKEVIKLKDPQGLTKHKAAVMKMQTSVFCQVMGEPQQQAHKSSGFQSFNSTTFFQPQKSSYGQHNGVGTVVEVNTGGSKPLDTGQHSSHVPLRPRQIYTDAELDDMRRNKICFKCKGPFFKGHPCSQRELQVLTVINGFPLEILDQDLDELQKENNKLIGDLMEFSNHSA